MPGKILAAIFRKGHSASWMMVYGPQKEVGKMFRSLMQYGMGRLADNARTQSCVYSSWMSHGLPREDFFGCDVSMMKVSKLLKKEGIQLIVTGHRPVGDAPWPIQLSPKNGDETAT